MRWRINTNTPRVKMTKNQMMVTTTKRKTLVDSKHWTSVVINTSICEELHIITLVGSQTRLTNLNCHITDNNNLVYEHDGHERSTFRITKLKYNKSRTMGKRLIHILLQERYVVMEVDKHKKKQHSLLIQFDVYLN